MSNPLTYPMAAHVGLTALLYALLTIVRAPAIWGIGRRPDGSNPWAHIEPRITANLSNQFEWPLFFYVVCLMLLQQNAVDHLQLGWRGCSWPGGWCTLASRSLPPMSGSEASCS